MGSAASAVGRDPGCTQHGQGVPSGRDEEKALAGRIGGAVIGGEIHELSTSGAWPRAAQSLVTVPALLGVQQRHQLFQLCLPRLAM